MVLAAVTGLLGLRVLGSPDIELYRTAMAPAPQGGVYVALAGRRFVQVGSDGGVRSEWLAPPGIPLSLAASGDNLLMGTDGGLHLSVNRGRTWERVIPRGRFLAVAMRGDLALAGAWADGLWLSRDAGQSWVRVGLAAGDTEIESIAIGPAAAVVATLLGAQASADGSIWERTALPGRMTAVDTGGAGFLAGAWRGAIFTSADGRSWEPSGTVNGGVWGVAGAPALVGTTTGLFSASGEQVALHGREVSAVAASGGAIFAAIARGPVLASADGGRSWRLALQR